MERLIVSPFIDHKALADDKTSTKLVILFRIAKRQSRALAGWTLSRTRQVPCYCTRHVGEKDLLTQSDLLH